MRVRVIVLILSLLSLPAQAQDLDICEALWLSRNAVLDDAGQCFPSPLGQAVFDNTGCSSVAFLLPGATRAVDALTEYEANLECKIETGDTTVAAAMRAELALYEELAVMPVENGEQTLCTAYRGEPFWTYGGTGSEMGSVELVQTGQTLRFSGVGIGDYRFARVFDDGDEVARGWVAQGTGFGFLRDECTTIDQY